MGVDLQVKSGDTRDWRFVISDTDDTALDLTGATINFALKQDEWDTTSYFIRQTGTGGTNSDLILISDASNGVITITPSTADWTGTSDNFGIFVGELKVTTSAGTIQYTKDIVVDIQEEIV